jgi:hypothetical protein
MDTRSLSLTDDSDVLRMFHSYMNAETHRLDILRVWENLLGSRDEMNAFVLSFVHPISMRRYSNGVTHTPFTQRDYDFLFMLQYVPALANSKVAMYDSGRENDDNADLVMMLFGLIIFNDDDGERMRLVLAGLSEWISVHDAPRFNDIAHLICGGVDATEIPLALAHGIDASLFNAMKESR